jgi:crotonobetainyl-CoA:carnitine CoA-transferase CaiB-like acyl-CoA transferase
VTVPAGGPLAGVRVLSVAENFPGPYATMLLADLGADVVKVERVTGGDSSRIFGGIFTALNRDKRSVALDLKAPEGHDALLALAAGADVFVEGYRPGTADRLGIGYDALRERAPGLVYVSISGYGQSGPYACRPGHDLSFAGVAGLAASGAPDREDLPPLGDLSSALFATIATLAALRERDRTGHGVHVDLSMTDSLIAALATQLVPVWNAGTGAGLPTARPGYGIFATADGRQLTISISYEDHFWRALCESLGWTDEATMSFPERIGRADELQEMLAREIATRPLAEWIARLDSAGVPFGPVNEPADVWRDPQVDTRRVAVEGPGQDGGRVRYVRQPAMFEGAPTVIRRPPPRLGEHTRELLAEAELDAATIDDLVARSIAGSDRPQSPRAGRGS